MLPFTGFVGALREALCNVVYGLRVAEPVNGSADLPAVIFGGTAGDPTGDQSLLVPWGPETNLGKVVELRDHVRLDPTTGLVAHQPGAKGPRFDRELVARGTRFEVRCELRIPPATTQANRNVPGEAELVTGLLVAVRSLHDGHVGLGAATTRGLGQVRLVEFGAKRFDTTTSKGWDELLCGSGEPTTRPVNSNQIGAWLKNAPLEEQLASSINDAVTTLDGTERKVRNDLTVRIPVSFRSGILVRAPAGTATGPDVEHLRSGDHDMLPGTSQTGPLRVWATRRARHIRRNQRDGDEWVRLLFGPDAGTENLSASPLVIREVPLHGFNPNGVWRAAVTRVEIDDFSGGVVQHKLFTETVAYGTAELVWELRLPRPGVKLVPGIGMTEELANALRGFVVVLARDVWAGRVAFGGASSVGHGYPDPGDTQPVFEWSIADEQGASTSEDSEWPQRADCWVTAFAKHPAIARSDARAPSTEQSQIEPDRGDDTSEGNSAS